MPYTPNRIIALFIKSHQPRHFSIYSSMYLPYTSSLLFDWRFSFEELSDFFRLPRLSAHSLNARVQYAFSTSSSFSSSSNTFRWCVAQCHNTTRCLRFSHSQAVSILATDMCSIEWISHCSHTHTLAHHAHCTRNKKTMAQCIFYR